MAADFLRENEESRAELRALIAHLTDADYARGLGNSWSVSIALCHLAFWDRLALRRIQEWQRVGFDPARFTSLGVVAINDAARAISEAVPGHEAARLAIESADELDAEVAKLSVELIDQINANGFERTLRRSLHRREHLRRIAETIGAA